MPVRPVPVVMGGVLIQNRAQVPLPGDQHPVGDLGPDGVHPAAERNEDAIAAWRSQTWAKVRG